MFGVIVLFTTRSTMAAGPKNRQVSGSQWLYPLAIIVAEVRTVETLMGKAPTSIDQSLGRRYCSSIFLRHQQA